MITLAWPWMLAALPLPLLARFLLPRARESRGGALRVPFFHRLADLPGGGAPKPSWRWLTLGVMTLAWIALVIAAARPQWVGEPEKLPAKGRDIVLALDLSGSMAREDFAVSGRAVDRLSIVKAVAESFVKGRKGDRIGLVLFGTRAYLQTPLTYDRATVARMIDEAEIGLAGEETAIGDAIGIAVKRLKDQSEADRVMVLLTDGSNNAGALDPVAAAKLAADAGIRIHTIGVGAEAMRGAYGQLVNPSMDLDERTLGAIADATGGRYFRARDTAGLAQVWKLIDAMEPTAGDPQTVRPTRQLFDWPLAVAVLLSLALAAARLVRLPQTRRAPSIRAREA